MMPDINLSKIAIFATVLLFFATQGCSLFSYESAYQPTPVSKVETKTIPLAKTLTTRSGGDYFDRDNDLFMRLFNYIKKNDIAMTVPVEAALDDADMRFYVGDADWSKAGKNQGAVSVAVVPERLVVSLGGRGSYTKKNVTAVRTQLEQWLEEQGEFKAVGTSYAVFWNGPFTPGFMKRFEIHVPVERIAETNDGDAQLAKVEK